jgi:hypothetical protein
MMFPAALAPLTTLTAGRIPRTSRTTLAHTLAVLATSSLR